VFDFPELKQQPEENQSARMIFWIVWTTGGPITHEENKTDELNMETCFFIALICSSAYLAVSFKYHQLPVSSLAKTTTRYSLGPVFHSPTETLESSGTRTVVSITASAINKMNSLYQEHIHLKTTDGITTDHIAVDICFRVGIKDGGCSGMSYVVQPIDRTDISNEDLLEVHEGISCAIDKFSLIYIEGMLIDYQQELRPDGEQPGFAFKNPLASSSW